MPLDDVDVTGRVAVILRYKTDMAKGLSGACALTAIEELLQASQEVVYCFVKTKELWGSRLEIEMYFLAKTLN